MMEEGSGKV